MHVLQLDEAKEKCKSRTDKFRKLMARYEEKKQKLQEANRRAEDMEAQLKNTVTCVSLCRICAYQGPVLSAKDSPSVLLV